ncbi:uncharacterized protein LOC134238513 isoform X2 [Saccostrea cucullata]|uniref:uncharacterized protein LOC134238513 isoform X2 n=1 Tax=Saccostrea cuccullata TaxID=36930 RepID=UPI002ED4298C
MYNSKIVLCLGFLAVGIRLALAALGGGSCTIPTAGNPGASTVCTGTANGFCLIDTFTTAGNPLSSATTTGVCVCYYGYTGSTCGTVDSTATTTSSSGAGNAIAALGLGLAAAWALSQGLGSGAGASSGSFLGK